MGKICKEERNWKICVEERNVNFPCDIFRGFYQLFEKKWSKIYFQQSVTANLFLNLSLQR